MIAEPAQLCLSSDAAFLLATYYVFHVTRTAKQDGIQTDFEKRRPKIAYSLQTA